MMIQPPCLERFNFNTTVLEKLDILKAKKYEKFRICSNNHGKFYRKFVEQIQRIASNAQD